MILFLAFLLGLIAGSFLNVCIYRMPKDESIVRPRSRCPDCGQMIRWYDNIPVLSFLLLGGRCRDCGAAISFRYPIVELLAGALFALIAWEIGVTLAAVKYALFVSMMLALGFADLSDRILPNEITLGGAAVGLALSVIEPIPPGIAHLVLSLAGHPLSPRWTSVIESMLGAVVASGMLWVIAEVYYRIRLREGMGLGDVKMMALIGAFLGLQHALLAVMVASILGALLGVVFILLFRKGLSYELPFGTFLAFASILLVVLPNGVAK